MRDTGAGGDGMGSGERHGALTEPSRHHGGAGPLSPATGALPSSLPCAGGGGRPARYRARAVSPRFRHARGRLPAESREPEPDLPLPVRNNPRRCPPHSPGPGQPRQPTRAAPPNRRRSPRRCRCPAPPARSAAGPLSPPRPSAGRPPGLGQQRGGGPAAGRGLPGPCPRPRRSARPALPLGVQSRLTTERGSFGCFQPWGSSEPLPAAHRHSLGMGRALGL